MMHLGYPQYWYHVQYKFRLIQNSVVTEVDSVGLFFTSHVTHIAESLKQRELLYTGWFEGHSGIVSRLSNGIFIAFSSSYGYNMQLKEVYNLHH